jgi:hypothetical protein
MTIDENIASPERLALSSVKLLPGAASLLVATRKISAVPMSIKRCRL